MNRKYLSRMLTILLSMAMIVTSMSLAFATDQEPVQSDDQDVAEEVVDEEAAVEEDAAPVEEDSDASDEEIVEEAVTEEDAAPAAMDAALAAPIINSVTVTGTPGNNSFKVSWDPVTAPDGSEVSYAFRLWYDYDNYRSFRAWFDTPNDEGELRDPTVEHCAASGISENSYLVPDKTVFPNRTYAIQVGAYVADPALGEYDYSMDPNGVVAWSDIDEEANKIPVTVKAPTNPKWSIPDKKARKVKITWTAAKGNFESYSIYEWYTKDGNPRWKGVKKNISKKKTSITFEAKSGTHKYAVRTNGKVRPNGNPTTDYAYTKKLKVKVPKFEKIHTSMDWKVKFYKNTPLYKSSSGSSKIKTVKKKTKGAVAIGWSPKHISDWGTPNRVQVRMKNGQVGWVPYSYVDVIADNTWKDNIYTRESMENYANKFSSKTKYLIWCNKYSSRVYVFTGKKGKWKLKKEFKVTVGKFYQPVSTSTSKTLGAKYGRVYHLTENGTRYYFDYARSFHGSGYFHTRSYWASGGAKNSVQLRPNTRGCIRMYTSDAKYIYSLPIGTRVIHK